MVVQAVLIIFSSLIFLFTLFLLSREDFIFLRKNVSLYEVFDVAFLVLLFALFFARLCYVIFHFRPTYLNPLVFFLLPYYPGLSLVGGVLGALITILVLTKRHKYPRGRFLDFFAFAFLSALPLGSLSYLVAGEKQTWFIAALPFLYYTLLFLFFLRVLLPRFIQGQMRDGMLGSLILMNYALFSVVIEGIQATNAGSPFFTPQLGIFMLLFIVSLIFYLRQGLAISLRR